MLYPPAFFLRRRPTVALGHLHKSQFVGRESIRYSGSLIPLSSTEQGLCAQRNAAHAGHRGGALHQDSPGAAGTLFAAPRQRRGYAERFAGSTRAVVVLGGD